jgi:hypothetical protein
MFNTLSYIGEKLNSSGVVWAVGASMLLYQYGLVDKPNDIDIFVDTQDIDKADGILKGIGRKKVYEKTTTYSTEYFYEYIINGIDVDVMAGFKINHSCGVFKYPFDSKSISEVKEINGVDIPFTSLEDWYVIYQLIPNREVKVNMIEKYLTLNGVKNTFLLERALDGELPMEVSKRIRNLLHL